MPRSGAIQRKDARVDDYIRAAPPFAQPVLRRLRAAWLKAHPDVTETLKWGVPYYEYRGLLGGMAAFKAHVSLGFRKAKQMRDPSGIFTGGSGMSASRIHTVKDLPAESVLLDYMREALTLNEKSVALPRSRVQLPAMPADFGKALKANAQARTSYEKFPPSQQREYLEWILEAKQAATRERRLDQAIEWLTQGKPRNWKYMKKK